jgi:uncharacterized protein
MSTQGHVLVAAVIAVGLFGIVVPVLPGILLCWGAVAVWAYLEGTAIAWIVFGGATVVAAASQIVKYLVPGRRMRDAGVPWETIAAGAILAIVGFFVLPVVGLFVGFVLGIYAMERHRLGNHDAAWPATKQALHAVGLSIVIELGAGLIIATCWLGAVALG